MSDQSKPPIGVEPEWCWRHRRARALHDAIYRYMVANRYSDVVAEWARELAELIAWEAERVAKRDAQKTKDSDLRFALELGEHYATAYKCACNPMYTRDDASAHLKHIRAAIERLSMDSGITHDGCPNPYSGG